MAPYMLVASEAISDPMIESRFVYPEGSSAAQVPVGVALPHEPPAPETTEAAPKEKSQSLLELLKWTFSFPAMLGTLLVGAVFVAGRSFAVDPDLWWHIKSGQNILATLHWPTADPYSFTVAGTPWLAYEWLGDVLLGAVARFTGLCGLEALLIILGSVILIALYTYATLRSGNSKAGFVTAATLYPLVTPSLSLRPQMLGYLFIILTLIVLEHFRQGKPRSLWFLPPLFLLWINTHGSWVIGLAILFVFLAGGLMNLRIGSIEARRWSAKERVYLEGAFLLCLTAIALTPYGTRLTAYPFTVASSLPINLANVLEWRPMPFNLLGGKIFLALLLGFFLAQMALHFPCRLDELALFVGGTAMACLHVRFVLLFVPFFCALLGTLLARWVPPYDRQKDRYAANAALMAVIIAAMVWYFPTRTKIREIISREFPVRAVEYLRSHVVPGPMYNTYGYGGYLIWALPEQKVFIDGRGDLYEVGGVFSDYLQVANLQPTAFAVLRAYGIQSCLLERSEALATVLSNHPDWREEYSDDVSVLLVRRNATKSVEAMRGSAAMGQKE
jgi:hypothetical protein